MNFEPPFLIVGLELWSTRTCRCQCKRHLHVYPPLSSSPGMTISYICHDAKRGEGGDPRPNVIMTLIFKKIVWKCPLRLSVTKTWTSQQLPLQFVTNHGNHSVVKITNSSLWSACIQRSPFKWVKVSFGRGCLVLGWNLTLKISTVDKQFQICWRTTRGPS